MLLQSRRDHPMATLNITLPDAMKSFVHEQAAKQGFGTVSEYMRAIIGDLQEREDRRREIREKLLEAVHSGPATPLNHADWDGIRREVHERHAKRQGRANGQERTDRR
jgi:antitoxin ParD1/3/4